jgi:hypothetical protein
MFPDLEDLLGYWVGRIVHRRGAPIPVVAELKSIQDDGSIYGTYFFPINEKREKGGVLTAQLFGALLFVESEDDQHGEINFALKIEGAESPIMMYGAIPRASNKAPRATVTLFPFKFDHAAALENAQETVIQGIWQTFFLEGL